jgi:HAE1 family hydrophobic/amphiphilic exporter-1
MTAAMKNLPGFNSISSNLEVELPTVSVKILRDRAALLNVSAQAIENVLRLAYSTSNLSPINEPENQYYVIMETLPNFYARPENLNSLYVANLLGDLVPLSTVVEVTQTASPLSVNHLNGMPAVTITFNLDGVVLGTALQSLDALAANTLLPSVTGSVQGSANAFIAAFADLNFLLLITFFVVYIILGILYENLLHPITVMSTLPPAALGGLLTLVLFNYPLSLYAFIGIILLLGIVMKNGIILVDFAIETIHEKKSTPLEAIRHSCLVRFRPILMTTIAAMMGALPIALGIGGMTALTRIPLGLVIVGGLIFSQILTMFFTPVVFYYLEVLRERVHGIKVVEETPKTPS